jgi:hypothetical protein
MATKTWMRFEVSFRWKLVSHYLSTNTEQKLRELDSSALQVAIAYASARRNVGRITSRIDQSSC